MSQYPLPPGPPTPYPSSQGPLGFDYYRPGWDGLAPARRASIVLWVVGGLTMLCGLCTATVGWVLPLDQMINQARSQMTPEQLNQLSDTNIELIRLGCKILGPVSLLVGIAMIVSGAFVRKGSRGGAITAIVACLLVCIWSVVSVLAGAVQAVHGAPAALLGMILWLLVGGLMVLTIYWLVQTLRIGPGCLQQQQWQAQYWQQHPQQFPGYGYGAPGAPAPQPPAPPPDSPPPQPPPPAPPAPPLSGTHG